MSDEIFIAGASVRSAAQSAVRAGLKVAAADLFCDRDLPPECLACRVEDYPRGILDVAQRIGPRPWSYTGGLENYPELVDAISRRHELLGNSAVILGRLRDPWHLQQVFERERVRYPAVLADPPHGHTGTWLYKPRRSCGGMHIGIFSGQDSSLAACRSPEDSGLAPRSGLICHANKDSDQRRTGFYYQRRIRGIPYGAVFVGSQGRAALLGVTRQLVGCQWAGATGFRYVGSVGPVDLGAMNMVELQRIGDCLAAEFSLRGLFGVDVIVASSGIWVIEVNPRFTASVEILERATGIVAMALHRAACCELLLPGLVTTLGKSMHGKAIVYARNSSVVNAEFYRALESEPVVQFPCFADLPHEGITISAGHPILTVFAEGDQISAVLSQLRARAAAVQRFLS